MFSFESFPTNQLNVDPENTLLNGFEQNNLNDFDYIENVGSLGNLSLNNIHITPNNIIQNTIIDIISKHSITTITSIFSPIFYSKMKNIIFKFNNHSYRTIENYNKPSEEIEQELKQVIDENKNRMLTLVGGEKGLLRILDDYLLPYNDVLKILLKNNLDLNSKEIFLSCDMQIYSLNFIIYIIEEYISKLDEEKQELFFIEYIKNIPLDEELSEFLFQNKSFNNICNKNIIILMSFLYKVDNNIEEYIINNKTKLDIKGILREKKLSLNTLQELSINQDEEFWKILVETQDITEEFVIENNDNINIYSYSKNKQLSERFVSLFSDKIDWNSVLKNNTYSKEFLRDYQYDLLYYLYSLKMITQL